MSPVVPNTQTADLETLVPFGSLKKWPGIHWVKNNNESIPPPWPPGILHFLLGSLAHLLQRHGGGLWPLGQQCDAEGGAELNTEQEMCSARR